MPMYDYRRSDGSVFEALRPYNERKTAVDEDGIEGSIVWIKPPSASIPIWHQSAPKEDASTVRMMQRAADPSDYVRVLEDGEDNNIRRTVEERDRKAQDKIDRAVIETMREHDISVPE